MRNDVSSLVRTAREALFSFDVSLAFVLESISHRICGFGGQDAGDVVRIGAADKPAERLLHRFVVAFVRRDEVVKLRGYPYRFAHALAYTQVYNHTNGRVESNPAVERSGVKLSVRFERRTV